MPIVLGNLASAHYTTAGSGGPTAPTFVLTRTDGPANRPTVNPTLTTPSFDVANGDLLVVCFTSEDASIVANGLPTGSLGGFTYTSRQSSYVASHTGCHVWTAPVTSDQTGMTVSLAVSDSSGARWCGLTILLFRAHGGVGNSATTTNTSTASVGSTVSVPSVSASSAIVVVVGDWAAIDNTSHSYRTDSAGAGTDVLVGRDTPNGNRYGWYIGRYANAGAAGAKNVGYLTPRTGSGGTQTYAIIGLEVKGL